MPARADRVTDPAIRSALLLARRGQSFFARKLNQLGDADLDRPSLLPGWSRRHVVAHVGLNARALTRLTTWAATGTETPMYGSPEQRDDEIAFTATLPPAALRHLSEHAAIHLSVEWRDLEPVAWQAEVRTAQGRLVPAAETVWMRTREVWLHAVDLDNGARIDDFPAGLTDALLADVVTTWHRKGITEPGYQLRPVDRPGTVLRVGHGPGAAMIIGTAAALLGWATGRSPLPDSAAPRAPRWL